MHTGHTHVGVGVAGREQDLTGATLAGRYTVIELLGSGGMGAVYRAHDCELDEMVALKVIRADHAGRPGMLEQFRHEVKLARRVTHVNIARTFELAIADGVTFCTMELVEGESLRKRLEREGAMTVAEAVGIVTAICEGLAVAHAAGVIHRDIKPDNVLLTASGRVVIADFGVAALGAADADGSLVGTLEYMAPEQARGEQATPATDIYAVGIVLFEMLTGLRAFSGSMSELIVAKQDRERVTLELADPVTRESVPADLKDVVARSTARDPAQRIGSAHELARRLAPWLMVQSVATSPGVGRAAGGNDAAHTEGKRLPAELSIVVVLAPRGTGDRMHLAEGVHQELLRRLAGQRRLRVWPRVEAPEVANGTLVELTVTDQLAVAIRRGDLVSRLSLPLEISAIGFAADAIAAAIVEVIERRIDTDANERLELLLKARRSAQAGFHGIRPAAEILKGAFERWPTDPRFACELAGLVLRFGFSRDIRSQFPDARELVAVALTGTPELAESHVAAAHLDLHDGDPILAARAFRRAIALSPYQAEGHEGLGRMLLEAGYLDDAMSRLDDALAIAPHLSSVRWEIARAHALESNWLVHDELVERLMARNNDRPIARTRFAIWRNDRARIVAARDAWSRFPVPFEHGFMETLFRCLVDNVWERDRMVELTLTNDTEAKRRRAFLAQVCAEAAGYFGDVQVCLQMMTEAVSLELFDRHWFDRCPSLAAARETPEGRVLQHTVTARAEGILDALYGDQGNETVMETADTMLPR